MQYPIPRYAPCSAAAQDAAVREWQIATGLIDPNEKAKKKGKR